MQGIYQFELAVLARCGSFITIWKMAKFGFCISALLGDNIYNYLVQKNIYNYNFRELLAHPIVIIIFGELFSQAQTLRYPSGV
ncbi:uncharacterized protein LOC123918693 isoform X2 [Trifolium pratense]|uniref:uncharacterized protein LOC123888970 isoform X2 n=1 Tax=Trifolium pratense TaxID=57577 RepID=UPI001E6968A2|nr:uncharacterized protein LOC123888970 isoform X2 [Trifolium pratense]XP_045826772.1 uncharacterized protein LOC123918693 isoform X2 [Trifolium pratense]